MYTITQATVNDVEIIRSLARQTWWEAYPPILENQQISYMLADIYSAEKITAQIKNNLQTYLLLHDEGQPVAFAAFSPREENPDIYKLHKLYCLPSTQGKGYGKILMGEVMNEVIKAGKHTLELNVNRRNKARHFYEKLGFKVIYQEDIPIGPYFMNDYVMRKQL